MDQSIAELLNRRLQGAVPPAIPLYLVGGTVRDLIMGRPVRDYDLVCRGAADVAARAAARSGATLVPMEKKCGEACYRVIDAAAPDRFMDIAEMRGTTITDDLTRRDYTVNAMALQILESGTFGELIDPLGGVDDIAGRIIRLVHVRALTADPLRIVRAFRLAGELGFAPEPVTRGALMEQAGQAAHAAPERITTELRRIFTSGRSAAVIRSMDDLGILTNLFPEIVPMKNCLQNGYHHADVWEHSLLVLTRLEEILNDLPAHIGEYGGPVEASLGSFRRPLLVFAALLHDVGKPGTRSVRPDGGRITFYRHDREGSTIMGAIAERLRMANAEKEYLCRIVAGHLRPLALSSRSPTGSALRRWFRQVRDDAVPLLLLAMADVRSSCGPESTEAYRTAFASWVRDALRAYFAEAKPVIDAPLLVSGHDLIELGMEPGISLGKVLCRIRLAQDLGEITDREGALSAARQLIRGRRS